MTKPRGAAKGCKPDKIMREALVLALKREATDGEGVMTRKLNLIADKLVEKALAGDIQAIKEINDRVDGRPSSGDGSDAVPALLQRIERVIVRPETPNPEASDTGGL